MSDLFENHIVGFPTRQLNYSVINNTEDTLSISQYIFHLFFSRYGAIVDRFGKGDGRYWFDELQCHGNETDLLDCASTGLGIHDCWDYEAVGVVCGERHYDNTPMQYTEIFKVVKKENFQ